MKIPIAVPAILLFAFLLTACSGGGGGDPATLTSDPTSGSNWDQMKWDQGQWQ